MILRSEGTIPDKEVIDSTTKEYEMKKLPSIIHLPEIGKLKVWSQDNNAHIIITLLEVPEGTTIHIGDDERKVNDTLVTFNKQGETKEITVNDVKRKLTLDTKFRPGTNALISATLSVK